MRTCETCGSACNDGMAFCTSCGVRLPDTVVPVQEESGHEQTDCICWSRKIPLITNPFLVVQCIALPLLIAGVFGGIFSFWMGTPDMLVFFLILCGAIAVLFLVILALLQLVTGGGLETGFFISSEGVAHRAGSTTRALDRASASGSAVLGSMPGTGAGLIAMSQECTTIPWEEVRYISVYPSVRSIVFRTKYLISPVVLYCSEENFSAVRTMANRYAPPQAGSRR